MQSLKKAILAKDRVQTKKDALGVTKVARSNFVDEAWLRDVEQAEAGEEPRDWLAFCEAMSRHRGHPELQYRACRCLVEFMSTIVPENHIMIKGLGLNLVHAVVGAMLSHKEDRRLVGECLNVCSRICAQAEVRMLVGKADGVRRIVSAMDRHALDEKVQEHGCAGLTALAVNCDNSFDIQRAGGVNKILTAMDNHKMNPRVQEQGCNALRNLAVSHENRRQIGNLVWGMKRVLTALVTHRSDASVVPCVLTAIANLTANNMGVCLEVGQMGGVQVLFETLQEYPQNLIIQERGILCLRNLSTVDTNQVSIVKLGVTKYILDIMEQHQSQICKTECLKLLGNCARLESNHAAMHESKCLQHLSRLMAETLEEFDAVLIESAILSIYNLINRSEQCQELVRGVPGLEATIQRAVEHEHATKHTSIFGKNAASSTSVTGSGDDQPTVSPNSTLCMDKAIIRVSVGSEYNLEPVSNVHVNLDGSRRKVDSHSSSPIISSPSQRQSISSPSQQQSISSPSQQQSISSPSKTVQVSILNSPSPSSASQSPSKTAVLPRLGARSSDGNTLANGAESAGMSQWGALVNDQETDGQTEPALC